MDVDFKCLWILSKSESTSKRSGRVVIAGKGSTSCSLFLDVRNDAAKHILKLDKVTDVMHRGDMLQVIFDGDFSLRIYDLHAQKRSNRTSLTRLKEVFLYSKAMHTTAFSPPETKPVVRVESAVSDVLLTSPKMPLFTNPSNNVSVSTTPSRTPVRSVFGPSPILSSSQHRYGSRNATENHENNPASVTESNRARKRLSDELYALEYSDENVPENFQSTPSSKLLSKLEDAKEDAFSLPSGGRKLFDAANPTSFYKSSPLTEQHNAIPSSLIGATPPSSKRRPGLLDVNSAISSRSKLIMQNSQQVTCSRTKKLQLEKNGLSHGDENDDIVGKGLEYSNTSNGTVSSLAFRQPAHQATLIGFKNLGNTCYMNAILHSLFSLVSFSTDLLSCKRQVSLLTPQTHATADGSLLSAMVELIQSQLDSARFTASREQMLTNVKNAISNSARRFSGHQQHDAHEFLCQLLDQLKEEVQAKWSSVENQSPSTGVTGDDDHQSNPTVDNFEFTIRSTFTCNACGHVGSKCEIYHDLSVDFPRRRIKNVDSASLQEAVDNYFKSINIELKCDACQSTSATLSKKIVRLPRVLIIHLKRYAFNSVVCHNAKDSRKIFIPKFLTLETQCCNETSPACSMPKPHDLYKVYSSRTDSSSTSVSDRSGTKPMKENINTSAVVGSTISSNVSSQTDYAGIDTSKYSEFMLENMTEDEQLNLALKESAKTHDVSSEIPSDILSEIDSSTRETSNLNTDEEKRTVIRHTARRSMRPANPVSLSPSDSDKLDSETVDCALAKAAAVKTRTWVSDDEDDLPTISSLTRRRHEADVSIEEPRRNSPNSNPDQAVPSLFGSPVTPDGTSLGGLDTKAVAMHQLDEELQATEILPQTDGNCDSVDGLVNGDNKESLPALPQLPETPTKDAVDETSLTFDDGFDKNDFEKAIQLSLMDLAEENKPELELNEAEMEDEINESDMIEELEKVQRYEMLRTNADAGDLPYPYQLCSVVSHLGDSTSVGHYITDVYDVAKSSWLTYDDSFVKKTNAKDICEKRNVTGYIFFYHSRDLIGDLEGFFKDDRHKPKKTFNFSKSRESRLSLVNGHR